MKCDCFIIIFYGEKTMDLFEYAKSKTLDQESPLASRLRPTTLDEVVGQQHIIGKNTLLYRAIKADKLTSVIFYGPPGTGKTQIILNIIANILVAGKTVLVVSNNNSATDNVLEKLLKYEFGFLAAPLGNSDNKQRFIESQEKEKQ